MITPHKPASLAKSHFGDSPFRTLFQNAQVNLQHCINGYDRSVLLEEELNAVGQTKLTKRFPTASSAFAASVIPMIVIGGAVLGTARPAEAADREVLVTGFNGVGDDCEATFMRNPAVIKDVTNVNIKIGGPIAAVPDPGSWHINSPTVVMPDGMTGVHVVVFKNGVPHHEYDESNTVVHNGPFASGTWTVNLSNTIGAACSVYDDHVHVTFTLVP